MTQVTVAIQAGGQSRRMGYDKAFALLHGRPLIVHVLAAVRPLADELIITTNRPHAYAALDARLVADAAPGAGALPGLRTALASARHPVVLVVACDMPCLQRPLLVRLLALLDDAVDAVVPTWDGHRQPLHAVYRRAACLPAVETALAAGQLRADSFLSAVRLRAVTPAECAQIDPHGVSFTNINTAADLSRLQARGAQEAP